MARYRGDYYLKTFSGREQHLAMAAKCRRSTLAEANEGRDWRIRLARGCDCGDLLDRGEALAGCALTPLTIEDAGDGVVGVMRRQAANQIDDVLLGPDSGRRRAGAETHRAE